MKLNLQQFTGYSLTIYTDAGITSATAAKDSGLAKNEETVLTITPATGYELDEVEIVSGGGSFNPETKKFKCGDADAVIFVKGKKNNVYKVTENCYVNVNGSATELIRNMMFTYGANGAITGIDCNGSEVTVSADVVKSLVAEGVLVKI